MNAAERHAAKLLIDRATRAKVQAQGRRDARLHGRTQNVEAAKTVFFPMREAGQATSFSQGMRIQPSRQPSRPRPAPAIDPQMRLLVGRIAPGLPVTITR